MERLMMSKEGTVSVLCSRKVSLSLFMTNDEQM